MYTFYMVYMTVLGRSITETADQRHKDSTHQRIAAIVLFDESDFFLCVGIVEKEVAKSTQIDFR